jgi:hypothetical protein
MATTATRIVLDRPDKGQPTAAQADVNGARQRRT